MRPPSCNTGVHPPEEGGAQAFAATSRFDWYRATVPVHPALLIDACMAMAGQGCAVDEGRGRYNYTHSTTIERGGDRVATILHGGSNGHPNVEASGIYAPALADLLRSKGPHRVTRADIARDLYGDRAFSDVEAIAMRIASQHRVALRKIANPLDPTAGETIYLGSRQSAVFARIYEKGKADRAHYEESVRADLNPWVRCELEVKPAKEMKAKAATMLPEEFWGISPWTRQLSEEAFNVAASPVDFHPRRIASDDKAFHEMCRQYRGVLRRRCSDRHGGNRMALALEIMATIFDIEEDQAA